MRIKSSCSLIALAVILSWGPSRASAQSTDSRTLGVYFDPQGTECRGTVRPGTPGTIYILGKVSNSAGLDGAAFRFIGAPASWESFAVPNPDMLAIGNPFANGVVAAFSSCQNPADGNVLMYTVLIVAGEDVQDVRFTLEAKIPLDNPNFPCPKILDCDAPIFTQICVESIPCFVNASQTPDCTLAVVEESWTAVKALFK